MPDARKPPRALPESTNRPPRSDCLRAFDETVKLLNDYFHGTKAAWLVLQKTVDDGGDVSASISTDLAARLNVPPIDLRARVQALDAVHCHVCLVHMVAAYEDFLRQLVQSVLERRPPPRDRKAKVEIAFDLICGDSRDGDLIHRLWAEQEAARVVGAGYNERPAEVRRALGIVPEELQDGRAPKFDLEQFKIACLMRNCIVHDGSRVDPRLKEALEKLGSPVPLGDPVLSGKPSTRSCRRAAVEVKQSAET